MLLKMESGIQKGTKSIYCAKGTFCRMMMDEHEWTKERAIQEWFNEYERARQQKRVSENGLKILMPVEDFLISYQDKSKADLVEMGTKDVKNPSDQQIAERVGWCGTDHESFGSDLFAGALGLEKSAFDGHQDNVFSKSSAPSKEQREEEDTKQEADAEKKERAKAKAEAKKAEKVFEKEAVLSTVLPLINKHLEELQEQMSTTLEAANATITDIEADPDKDKFNKAVEVLRHRIGCAKALAMIGDKMAEGGDAVVHETNFQEFFSATI